MSAVEQNFLETPVVDEGAALSGVAYARLKRAITTHDFKAGSPMREVAIAAQLQMSRTPVRDALRRLEAEGLLAHEAHRGLVVASLDAQAVLELYAMREVLEGSAASLAARYATDHEIEMMRQIARREAAALDDARMLVEINRQFHQAIFGAAHNRYLLKSLHPIHDAIALMGVSTLSDPERAGAAHAEHMEVIECIAARDVVRAEETARHHSRGSLQARLNLIRAAG